MVAFTYPAIQSIKALESKNAAESQKWLTYWIVYGYVRTLFSVTQIVENCNKIFLKIMVQMLNVAFVAAIGVFIL